MLFVNVEKVIGSFSEKELQRISKKESKIEKVIKIKGHKLYVKWKGYDNSSNSWLKSMRKEKDGTILPDPYEHSGGNVKVEFDLSNWTKKVDLN